jgi:hypothetical protein
MSEPQWACLFCGAIEIVNPDGRGFPPDIAKRRLAKRCKALGHDSSPSYLAGGARELIASLPARTRTKFPLIPELDFCGTVWKNVEYVLIAYAQGQPGVELVLEDGEVLTRVSVNLEAYELVPADGCIFIKDYSENEGLATALAKAGVVELTDRLYIVGPYSVPIREAKPLPPYTL